MAELQAGDPQRIGPYVLVGRLGSGGMGRVYLARSPGGRQVAVKVIRAELADVMAAQGLDEKAALKVVARARGVPRSEAYRLWQAEKSVRRSK